MTTTLDATLSAPRPGFAATALKKLSVTNTQSLPRIPGDAVLGRGRIFIQ
jgi:hypothetical protein